MLSISATNAATRTTNTAVRSSLSARVSVKSPACDHERHRPAITKLGTKIGDTAQNQLTIVRTQLITKSPRICNTSGTINFRHH